MFKFLKLSFAFLIAFAFSTALQPFGFDPVAVISVGFLASFIPMPSGVFAAGINVEIWQKTIIENLFKNNEFLLNSQDVSSAVVGGRIVHKPNAGAASGVVRNRTILPATVKRRADLDLVYTLDEFTSNPILLNDAEQYELSYDKTTNVLATDMANIRQSMAEWILYSWRAETATNLIATTGGAVAAYLTGQTGNRKAFELKNLSEAQARLDEQDVPAEDRFALFDARMYQQFVDALSATQYRDFSAGLDKEKGIVGEMYGFKIMKRSSVLRYTSAGVALTPEEATAATTNTACLIWQKNMVERALGDVKMFESKGEPTMYGDVYSFLVNGGGSKSRYDKKGVLAIVQAASA